MAEAAVAEPTTTDDPPLKSDYISNAKSVFQQQRVELGLDKPKEEAVAVDEPTKDEVKPEPDKKTEAELPEDIFAPPAESEPPKKSDAIAAIEAMELPKGAKEKTVAGFSDLKKKSIEEIQRAESKVAELERKIAAQTNGDTAKLEEKLKEAEGRASKLQEDYERKFFTESPRFQSRFIEAEKAEISAAQSYLEGTEVDPRVIEFAARHSGAKRLQILTDSGLEAPAIASIEARLAQFDAIQRNKQAAIDNWKTEVAQEQEQIQRAQEAENSRRIEQGTKVFDAVVSKLETTLLPLRKSKDENWNATAEKIRNEAREAFIGKGVPPEDAADIFVRGIADRYGIKDRIIEQLTKKTKDQDELIANLRSAAPGGTITQSTTTSAGKDAKPANTEAERLERAKEVFNSQLAIQRGQ